MAVAWYKEVPDDQRITYTITPMPGALLRATMVGGTIRALARMMALYGDEADHKWDSFIADIEMAEDGSIKIELAVLPKLPDEDDETA